MGNRILSPDPTLLMKRLLTIIGAITLFCGIVHAQQFPVQVTPQLLPPYSVKVSDYYSPGAAGAKLNILLLLRDFNKPQLQVRLRMTIEGQSVALRSREDAVFTPITIESGTPVYIDPSDLAQYFNPDNLDFSGITRQQYEQTGKLPEGFYTFCFEAIETSTNQSVSNRGCTFAWMTLNEPPILNLPRKAEGVIPVNPQNLIFQWTPRHTASPTAGYVTDYVFSIVEMNDNVIAPEAAFLSNEPLYTDSVTTTTYLYHAGLPSLIEGKKYAWRVQAKAKNGIQDLATFRNQGYSETSWFTYQNTCAVPSGVSASPQGQRVGIEWNSNPVHLEYKVEYREANNADAVWFEIGNTLPRVSIADLRPNTSYEYRVGGACEYGRFTFGNLMLFTTNDSNASMVANCGDDPGLTDPPLTLVQTFPVGDTIHAGDYDVIVTSLTGQTSFNGEGYVKMSWLGDANVAVRFTNIGINTDKQLASGVIETTYDPNQAGIVDVEEVIEEVKSIVNGLKEITAWLKDAALGDPELKENLEKFKQELTVIYNEELRLEGENLYNSLDSLNSLYLSLKEQFEGATTQPERDAIETQLNDLKEGKKNLETRISEFKDKLENGPKQLNTDEKSILVSALSNIGGIYNKTFIAGLKEDLHNKEFNLDQEIEEQRSSNVSVISQMESSEIFYLGSSTIPSSDTTTAGARYRTAEMRYNRAQILKAFIKTTNNNEELSLLADILKVEDVYYRTYVTQKRLENIPTDQIISSVQTAVENLATYIIESKIYK